MPESSFSLLDQKMKPMATRFGNQTKYELLNSTDEDLHQAEFVGDGAEAFARKKEQDPSIRRRPSQLAIVLTLINLSIFLASSVLFAVWYRHEHTNLNANLRKASSYSTYTLTPRTSCQNNLQHQTQNLVTGPVFDMIDLETSTQRINGTFYRPKDGGSIARQQPNPEADDVWDEWELTRVFPITKSDIVRLGKDPSTATKLEDEIWHLGDDAYAAIFDVCRFSNSFLYLPCVSLSFRLLAVVGTHDRGNMEVRSH